MTTHLEEVVEALDAKFDGGLEVEVAFYGSKRIKNFIINSHIAYLEKSIARLKERQKSWEYKSAGWEVIQAEISHKQQELLQAKELLK